MSELTLGITHHFGGGVYAKEARTSAGTILVQHKHAFDHLSILAAGTVELVVDGERRVLTAPTCLTIRAGMHHGIKALTDVVWYCVHATDCKETDRVDETLIVPGDSAEVQSIVEGLQ